MLVGSYEEDGEDVQGFLDRLRIGVTGNTKHFVVVLLLALFQQLLRSCQPRMNLYEESIMV